MNNKENFNDGNDLPLEERLKNILDRVPDKAEFISELEGYVDEINYEDEAIGKFGLLKSLIPVLIIILVLFKPAYRVFTEYKLSRPVSLKKLISLHEADLVTTKIMQLHMYAKPLGEAIKPIQVLADTGNMHAQNITCWVYMDGINVERNGKLGAEYCHKSAAQGHSGAESNLGHYYFKESSPPDINKAIYYYNLSAKERSGSAWNLAHIYENSAPPLRDFEKAVHFKKVAASLGDSNAMIYLGKDYSVGNLGLEPNGDLAVKYFTMAADKGHVDAHAQLAVFYLNAKPPHQDYKKMIFHSKKSITRGNIATGYGIIGEAYLKGLGVEKNEDTAIRYLSEAAKHGNQYAVFHLASLKTSSDIGYGDAGYGFKYDDVLLPYAVKNFLKYPETFPDVNNLIRDGSVDPVVISKMYEYIATHIYGDGEDGYVSPNFISQFYAGGGYKAEFQPIIKAYENRVAIGSGEHAYYLGLIYMSGSGVERNPKTCIEWISKAMDLGYPDVQQYVGNYLTGYEDLFGDGGKTDRILLMKAAILGSELAARSLSEMYQEGRSVNASKVAALYWMIHANYGPQDFDKDIKTIRNSMNSAELLQADNMFKRCTKSEFNACFSKL